LYNNNLFFFFFLKIVFEMYYPLFEKTVDPRRPTFHNAHEIIRNTAGVNPQASQDRL